MTLQKTTKEDLKYVLNAKIRPAINRLNKAVEMIEEILKGAEEDEKNQKRLYAITERGFRLEVMR